MKVKYKGKTAIILTTIFTSSILFLSMGYLIYEKDIQIEKSRHEVLEEKKAHRSSKNKYETTIDDMRLESNKKIEALEKDIENKAKEVSSLKKRLSQSIEEEKKELQEIEAARQREEQKKNETKHQISTKNVPSNDNWHKTNRRIVESGNNYNTFTSNGYLGAYQFAPVTWNAIANKHGLDPNDFSPNNQDRFADIYAQERYGGWTNVPTVGGW